MKIGCCIPKSQIARFSIIDKFDFVEAKYPDLKVDNELYKGLNVYALNNLFKRDINLFDQSLFDTKYTIDEIFDLAENLGIKFITLGSGGARRMAGSHSLSESISIWVEILRYLDQKAVEQNIEIGIEPLARLETNFVNTLAEAAFYIDQLNLERTGITADTFHFFSSDGSFINLEQYVEMIKHVHIASDERKYPTEISERNKTFINILKSNGYDRTVAIEVDWREDLESDPQIIYLLQELFNE